MFSSSTIIGHCHKPSLNTENLPLKFAYQYDIIAPECRLRTNIAINLFFSSYTDKRDQHELARARNSVLHV